MAMYYYASKISAIACGTRCRQSVLQKSRGQRDRDKFTDDDDDEDTGPVYGDANGLDGGGDGGLEPQLNVPTGGSVFVDAHDGDYNFGDLLATAAANSKTATGPSALCFDMPRDGMRHRRRHSEQSDAYDMLAAFQNSELAAGAKRSYGLYGNGGGVGAMDPDVVQYDVPRNVTQLPYTADGALNYENSVVGPGDIVYINGKIISGPLESLIDSLLPKSRADLDKLLGKLLSSVPDCESLDTLVALLDEWTNKFPYDYRDERMMNHVKHIVARCSSTRLEAEVSEILSALLKRLTDLERHEEDLRACQTTAAGDKTIPEKFLVSQTSSQYAQILCRLEKKLAKHIGPEEFLQCSSYILLDKQKKWDQPSATGGPPGAQDPKKTCNLETYLDWSARLRLFVCNEILQCGGIRDRSRTVELWSGVAQYCLLVGNYNSATAILETLESPPIARLKITWSKLQVTCQQLDCMQRHAEGHSDLWHKQSSVLNDTHHHTQNQHHQQQQHHQSRQQHALQQQMQQYQHHQQRSGKKHQQQKTEVTSSFLSSATASASTSANISASPSTATTTTMASATSESQDMHQLQQQQLFDAAATSLTAAKGEAVAAITTASPGTPAAPGLVTTMETPQPLPPSTHSPTGLIMLPVSKATDNMLSATPTQTAHTPAAATNEIASAMGGHNEGTHNINSNNNVSPGGTNLVDGLGESLSNCNINNKKPSLSLAAVAATASSASPSPSSSSSLPGSSCSGTATATTVAATQAKPNDWVVIPVFADIVKLALAGREDCLQRLTNGHINIVAFDRMAAIVGAFTKHMHAVKAATEMPPCEYEMFCWHMQKASKLNESELMMASFDCEEPNNAEKLMYDLN